MTIFKKNIFFTLTLSLLAQSCIEAKYWNWDQDPADPEAVKRIFEQTMESELQPHSQSEKVKNTIQNAKSNKANNFKQLVAWKYLSKYEAKSEAEQGGRDESINLALNIMYAEIGDQLDNAIKKQDKAATDEDLKRIYHKIKDVIKQKMRSAYRPATVLQDFTKPDSYNTTKIEQLVNQEVAKLPSNFKEKHFSENDIVEVYPQNKVDQMRLRVQQGKVWREDDCAVCGEEFSTLGKRVNLECGHAIMCMKCAVASMHIYKKYNCPVCRAAIDPNDFSLRYLKSNMKEYDYKIFEKLDQNTMKQIMDLFKRV